MVIRESYLSLILSLSPMVRQIRLLGYLGSFLVAVMTSANAQEANRAIRQPATNPNGRNVSTPANPPQPQQLPQKQLTTQEMMEQMKKAAPVAPAQVPSNVTEKTPEFAAFPPSFIPLPPEKEQALREVLSQWEKATKGIERYRCNFMRWQFSKKETSDPKQFYTAAKGVIRYMAPDKGMFKVEDLKFWRKDPRDAKAEWSLQGDPNQFGEWWICDGSSVYLYDRTDKKATKYELPPEMQGKEVFNSPLPFFFGVDAQKISQRFWVNPLPEAEYKARRAYVVEVYPKSQADAGNYHHVTVLLDKKEFLPVAIEVCMPNWNEENQCREFFDFYDRDSNWNFLDKLTENISVFKEEFIPKDPPAGWQVEVKPYTPEVPEEESQRVANPAPGNQPGLR